MGQNSHLTASGIEYDGNSVTGRATADGFDIPVPTGVVTGIAGKVDAIGGTHLGGYRMAPDAFSAANVRTSLTAEGATGHRCAQ